jgi:hypothetical protein
MSRALPLLLILALAACADPPEGFAPPDPADDDSADGADDDDLADDDDSAGDADDDDLADDDDSAPPPPDITVGCDDTSFATIAEAVAAALPGAVVEVCPGTYAETVRLPRAITLRARDPGERPVVQGALLLDHTAEDTELQAGDRVEVHGLRFESGGSPGFSILNTNTTAEPAIDLLVRDVVFEGVPDPDDPSPALFLRLGGLTGGPGSARFEDLTVSGYLTLLRIQPVGSPDTWTVELSGFSFEGASSIEENDLFSQSGFVVDSFSGLGSGPPGMLVRLEGMTISGSATPTVSGIVLYARGPQRFELIDTVVRDHQVDPSFPLMSIRPGVDAAVLRGSFLRNEGAEDGMIEVWSTLSIEGTDFGTGANGNEPFDLRVWREVTSGVYEAGDDYHWQGFVGPLVCDSATGSCS